MTDPTIGLENRMRTLASVLLLALTVGPVAAAVPDVGCPDPKGFVSCPKIGEVFPRQESGLTVYFADCKGRPKGYDRKVPNVPRPRGVHLKNERCGTARSDDPNLNDRPCGFYQRGESCNEGER